MTTEIPMKEKYTRTCRAKFGGKKRANGNSGGMGTKARARKRARVVGSRTSPEQYQTWYRAMGGK